MFKSPIDESKSQDTAWERSAGTWLSSSRCSPQLVVGCNFKANMLFVVDWVPYFRSKTRRCKAPLASFSTLLVHGHWEYVAST